MIIAVVMGFFSRTKTTWTYIQLKMQTTTAPRDETRLGVGWQISGRAVAAVILLPIDVRYAWQQGGAVGTCYCVIILQ